MSDVELELRTDARIYRVKGMRATIGRARDCAVRLQSRYVSACHATLSRDERGWWVTDQGSTNGTSVDGISIDGAKQLLLGSKIEIGDLTLTVTAISSPSDAASARRRQRASERTSTPPRRAAKRLTDPTVVHPLDLRGQVMTIGRDQSNDIVIDDRNVSRFHAELRRRGARWNLRDLGSCNGTRVNGKPIQQADLAPGSEINLGRLRLLVSAEDVRTESRAGLLEAVGIEQRVKGGQRILQPTDLKLAPGELTGIVGEAGAGKSTLMQILAGVSRPSAGTVLLDGEALALRLVDVGYVPQENALHIELTAREALTHGARLRLPPDTTTDEIAVVVDQVLHELDMEAHADIRIGGGLSGGQRRRVAVGMELLGSPRVLLLDEPGTSLDVVHERQLMALLRRVADRGCAVVCITHHIDSLRSFDRLVVMGRGGLLRLDGSPEAALAYFSAPSFTVMYERLAALPAGVMPASDETRASRPPSHPRQRTHPAFTHQTRVLTSRAIRILARDRRNLGVLLIQAPLLAAGTVLLFGAGAFGQPGHADRAAQLLFALVIVCCWLGAVDGARALVAERAIFIRERALGVAAEAYLTSKLIVLGALALAQALMLSAVAFTIDPLHASTGAYATVVTLLVLTTEVSMAMGLLLSALVSSENQAGSTLPLLLVPQVLCAGAIVAVSEMGVIAPLSVVVSSRWALAGSGSALALSERPAASASFIGVYGGFYSLPWSAAALVLIGLLAGIMWLTLQRLQRAWDG